MPNTAPRGRNLLAQGGLTGTVTGECVMRTFIALVVIVYLVGVGVVLAPTFSTKWNSATAADLFAGVWGELPAALAWPVATYHRMMDAPAAAPVKS
jgi:hypothetical protein